jgi:hypothetical protein
MKSASPRLLLCLLSGLLAPGSAGAEPDQGAIAVTNPRALAVERLPAERFAFGEPDDYKPCIALLTNGDLAVIAFHQHKQDGGKVREDMIRFRSTDSGRTWSKGKTLDLLGREPYFSVMKDGTLFITVHLLAGDVHNKDGFTHSYLHRSADGGKTGTTLRIGPDGFPPRAESMTSRNVLELADGTLLGVDSAKGPAFVWRSTDGGKTWDRSRECDTGGFKSAYSFFGEAVLWRSKSGKVLALVRVDSDEFPIAGRPAPGGKGDQRDHLVLYQSADECKSLRKVADFGDYGDMYPSVLRLQDGRLLLTLTVRSGQPPLGVQAVLGAETDDGFSFDFEHDRLVLDARTPKDKPSGGGFGPTVQLGDGTLVTAYSYRGADDRTHLETVRWKLPAKKP